MWFVNLLEHNLLTICLSDATELQQTLHSPKFPNTVKPRTQVLRVRHTKVKFQGASKLALTS